MIAIAMSAKPIAQAQNRYMVFTFLSLTVIILYHTLRDLSIGFGIFSLVKMHKIFGQKKLKLVILPKSLPRRPGAAGQKKTRGNLLPLVQSGIVSHIIRYYFNPCGAGSHLYTANANTLRSASSGRSYIALVGFPVLGCLPSAVIILYHTFRILSRGFAKFFLFF